MPCAQAVTRAGAHNQCRAPKQYPTHVPTTQVACPLIGQAVRRHYPAWARIALHRLGCAQAGPRARPRHGISACLDVTRRFFVRKESLARRPGSVVACAGWGHGTQDGAMKAWRLPGFFRLQWLSILFFSCAEFCLGRFLRYKNMPTKFGEICTNSLGDFPRVCAAGARLAHVWYGLQGTLLGHLYTGLCIFAKIWFERVRGRGRKTPTKFGADRRWF